MLADKPNIKLLPLLLLLFATLACRAASKLIIPDTPTPFPAATATFTPTLTPTFTPTAVVFEAVCPELLEKIVATTNSNLDWQIRIPDKNLDEDELTTLISYEVMEDEIGFPHLFSVPYELEDEQDDLTTHRAIWKYFVSIIPADEQAILSEFRIFTDGEGNRRAGVKRSPADPTQWRLSVDIRDAENYYDLTYTFIHEHGHLLTLNHAQVPPGKANSKSTRQSESADCSQYFTSEGCSLPQSYVNQFFDRFWTDLYPEWEPIDREEDDSTRFGMLEDFYKTYEDQFVTDYAPTSPVEDIAESWSFFVLSPKPEKSSIASEKVLFFYDYPELVELRTQILERICVEFPR